MHYSEVLILDNEFCMAFDHYYGWPRSVSAAERRRKAARELAKLSKTGHAAAPVVITGRQIAETFWGEAWCENLERYSDYASRLPRGRSYVRAGCVVDLQIAPGQVTARVSGNDLYTVTISVAGMPAPRWEAICRDVAGRIDSVIELLQGRLSKGVMARLCEKGAGLFPSPAEIQMSCNCPDSAYMCKHIAAVLYGIGARLDSQPELLFTLRKVNQDDLIVRATTAGDLRARGTTSRRLLEDGALSAIFGLDIAAGAVKRRGAKAKAQRSPAASRPRRP